MTQHRLALDDGSLVDLLDRLLDVGAYVDGTVLLTLADVDLVRLDLRLLLASIETLRPDDAPPGSAVERPAASEGRATPASIPGVRRPREPLPHQARDPASRTVRAGAGSTATTSAAARVHTAPQLSADESDDKDRHAGVAGLVVVVVDIVRQLLERQALRRMDAGTLTAQEVERLGRSLMALERQTAELTEFLGQHRRHHNPLGQELDTKWLGQDRLGPGGDTYAPEGRSQR